MHVQMHSLFRPKQASGRVAAYKYTEISPSQLLAPYVSCYWLTEPVMENQRQDASQPFNVIREETVDRVLPDGCNDILFVHDLKRNTFRIVFCGFFDSSFTITYDKNFPVRKFGVRFFPGGAHFLLGMPLHELANSHFDIDLVWPGFASEIGYRIFEEPSFENKAQIMEQYLLSSVRTKNNINDSLINNLLYHIFVAKGKTSVKELADKEVISARHMNRIFYQWIGTSPKRFCDVVRFQAIIDCIQSSRRIDGVSLALDHGYFDQAHMIRDFKRFYGDSPLAALREFGSMSDFYNP
ncbi:helix-turn-helix domain-containing protein [Paenibacillus radicis (ex Xue et al. 2023)]|uniref:Helix-turn-helix domain-containing protein n=1 Tax=Paenibacillus radicis (ex Xue et al. 2023) TaxID=2972489 RepID=A0ABT1YCD6_9BACL|nr:helix-turn-helix domain-containing protein [Paenibacillus radicis (ex Xue et al. 2023)]MCR8630425.1 helix-turn-helix domain-containing protein [Paenibacillus radicis (ex Xue et al. 2023)]